MMRMQVYLTLGVWSGCTKVKALAPVISVRLYPRTLTTEGLP
jgi:hypothetical protein